VHLPCHRISDSQPREKQDLHLRHSAFRTTSHSPLHSPSFHALLRTRFNCLLTSLIHPPSHCNFELPLYERRAIENVQLLQIWPLRILPLAKQLIEPPRIGDSEWRACQRSCWRVHWDLEGEEHLPRYLESSIGNWKYLRGIGIATPRSLREQGDTKSKKRGTSGHTRAAAKWSDDDTTLTNPALRNRVTFIHLLPHHPPINARIRNTTILFPHRLTPFGPRNPSHSQIHRQELRTQQTWPHQKAQ
jgi:hypothetical protein